MAFLGDRLCPTDLTCLPSGVLLCPLSSRSSKMYLAGDHMCLPYFS